MQVLLVLRADLRQTNVPVSVLCPPLRVLVVISGFAGSSGDLHRPLRQSEQSRNTPADMRERPDVRPQNRHRHGLVRRRVGGEGLQERRGRRVHAGRGGIGLI